MKDVDAISHWIDLEQINNTGKPYTFVPNSDQVKGLLKLFTLLSLDQLKIMVEVSKNYNKEFVVKGVVCAEAVQESIISLKPVLTHIEEKFYLLILSPKRMAEFEEDLNSDFDIEPHVDGKIDIGSIGIEYLSLALPIYPKLEEEE